MEPVLKSICFEIPVVFASRKKLQEFQNWLMIRLVSSLKQNIFKDEHSDILLPSINFLQAIRRRQLEVDRVELKRKIKEAVEQFDAKLLDLYKTRLAIEKCILAEELKILLYDRRMSIQDHLDREEERLQ